ncbi:MAG: aldo/keto reductase [Bacteroidales bacterium]|nr:aldo/keto reductase [Bacteroidales bacterium]
MKNIDRRVFLRSGIAGAATLAAASSGAYAIMPKADEPKIIYRTLGKTGITLPIVSMGVMRADNPNLIRAAMENGIVHYDTANGYQGGRNEKMLGDIWKEYPRDSFIVATKVKPAGIERQTGLPTGKTTAEDFLAKFEESMERLQLEYVDILYMHAIKSAGMVNHKEIVKAMKRLKKDGRVKHLGISTHTNEVEVIDAMIEAGFWEVVLTKYNFNLTYIDEMEAAIERAVKAGIGVVAMKTMAGGFFDKERTEPVNATAALKWALGNPNIHTSIPGMTSFDMLEDNLRVMSDLEMTEQEEMDIRIAENRPGLFCSACSKCLNECKNLLPVPDLMRAYMYAYGYANMEKAHTLLSDLGTGANPCIDCSDCNVSCAKNFDVKTKIADISRLTTVPHDFII